MLDHITEAEVKEAIEALPEQFRMAVLLGDVEGFSYKEIAEILDIPIGTVMSRLHRGRKALQKRLYEFGRQRGLVPEGIAACMSRLRRSGGACCTSTSTASSPTSAGS